jgi:hypothetical protein
MWVVNIEMDLRMIEGGDTDRIDLAKFRNQWKVLLNTVMKL